MYPDAAIFYDSNVVTPEDSGQYWLSRHPDRPFSIGWELSLPRIVDWAVFRHRTSGASFLFVSTHFDNNGKNKVLIRAMYSEGGSFLAHRFPLPTCSSSAQLPLTRRAFR